MKQNPSNKKFVNYLNLNITHGLKLNKGEQALKRNKSGFSKIKENKASNQIAITFQDKKDTSFFSHEFDKYYDNFLKSLHEDSPDKTNNVYNSIYKKDKQYHNKKSAGVKRTSIQFKPFPLQHQESEHIIDLPKVQKGTLPGITITEYNSNASKGENTEPNVSQHEGSSSPHRFQLRSMLNDKSKFSFNKQVDNEAITSPSQRKLISNRKPNDNEHHIEINTNDNNNNNIILTKKKSINQSAQSLNILSVNQTENFTLGEQLLKKKPTKDSYLSPKYTSPRMFKFKNQNNIDSNNNNILSINVMHGNPINRFNNAQKITICKNSIPLNSQRMNKSKVNSKNPSPRCVNDCPSVTSSFDKVTKKNEGEVIKQTNSKSISKKASNKNLMTNNIKHNNSPILQLPSQRNNEQILFPSDYEQKEQTRCAHQEQQIVVQHPQNFQHDEFINLKPRKMFFCIPCK